jgi:hypothetical protein
MERLLARLERVFGRFAIPNLIQFIVGGMAIVWVMSQVRPGIVARLTLDTVAVRHGEVWRLVTFLFFPGARDPIWVMISLYLTWWIGSSLDAHWGAFKFNAYYLLGAIGTIGAALIAGPTSNEWLNASLFLAFATVFPEVQMLVAFIIPVRVKWLGLVTAGFLGYEAITNGWDTRAAILAAFGNYVLFFADHWWAIWRGRTLIARQQVRREAISATAPPPNKQRACAICGAQEVDGADIRVCSCEKCGGKPRELCLTHARAH